MKIKIMKIILNISPYFVLAFFHVVMKRFVSLTHVLVQCWPIVSDAATLKQHKGNVTCLLGGGCSWRQSQCYCTASLMRGDRPHCVYTPTPNPPPTTCHSSHLLCSRDRQYQMLSEMGHHQHWNNTGSKSHVYWYDVSISELWKVQRYQ